MDDPWLNGNGNGPWWVVGVPLASSLMVKIVRAGNSVNSSWSVSERLEFSEYSRNKLSTPRNKGRAVPTIVSGLTIPEWGGLEMETLFSFGPENSSFPSGQSIRKWVGCSNLKVRSMDKSV